MSGPSRRRSRLCSRVASCTSRTRGVFSSWADSHRTARRRRIRGRTRPAASSVALLRSRSRSVCSVSSIARTGRSERGSFACCIFCSSFLSATGTTPFEREMSSLHPSTVAQLISISLIAQQRFSPAILSEILAFSLEATYASTPAPSLSRWLDPLVKLDSKCPAPKTVAQVQDIVSLPRRCCFISCRSLYRIRSPNCVRVDWMSCIIGSTVRQLLTPIRKYILISSNRLSETHSVLGRRARTPHFSTSSIL